MKNSPIFHRQLILSGERTLEVLRRTRVILFGVGGVGSWCAESLIRSGIGHLTLVDSDIVCASNINRQLPATVDTIGRLKVEVMAERLRGINPDAEIDARAEVFNWRTAETFDLAGYDYVLDAIDSLSPKVDLIQTALPLDVTLFSAMGASCKLDPTRVRVGSFWKVAGCPLASKVRKRLRKRKVTGEFLCVFSDELLEPFAIAPDDGDDCSEATAGSPAQDWKSAKQQINGSSVHVTAPFGFHLSWLVYRDVTKRCGDIPRERGRG